jgi:hypothetical protein
MDTLKQILKGRGDKKTAAKSHTQREEDAPFDGAASQGRVMGLVLPGGREASNPESIALSVTCGEIDPGLALTRAPE